MSDSYASVIFQNVSINNTNLESLTNYNLVPKIYVDNEITAEENRAIDAELSLNSSIENEVIRATSVETNLSNAINTEEDRATGVENNLTSSINGEITRAQVVENNIIANLNLIENAVYTNCNSNSEYALIPLSLNFDGSIVTNNQMVSGYINYSSTPTYDGTAKIQENVGVNIGIPKQQVEIVWNTDNKNGVTIDEESNSNITFDNANADWVNGIYTQAIAGPCYIIFDVPTLSSGQEFAVGLTKTVPANSSITYKYNYIDYGIYFNSSGAYVCNSASVTTTIQNLQVDGPYTPGSSVKIAFNGKSVEYFITSSSISDNESDFSQYIYSFHTEEDTYYSNLRALFTSNTNIDITNIKFTSPFLTNSEGNSFNNDYLHFWSKDQNFQGYMFDKVPKVSSTNDATDAVNLATVNDVDAKLDKTDGTVTGKLKIDVPSAQNSANSYLYIGDNWRITASKDGKQFKIEYNSTPLDDDTWNVAVPFIQS